MRPPPHNLQAALRFLVIVCCVLGLPAGAVASNIQTFVAVQGEVLFLSNNLPRIVRVVDLQTGVLLWEKWYTSPNLDLSELPVGTYYIKHAVSGESWQEIYLFLRPRRSIQTPNSYLFISNDLPRLMQIWSLDSDTLLSYSWIGAPTLLLSGLPPGEYRILHAKPGQTWQEIHLMLVPELSTTQIEYTLLRGNRIRLSWSELGNYTAFHLVLSSSITGETLLRQWVYGTSFEVTLAPGIYRAWVAPPGLNYVNTPIVVPVADPDLEFFEIAPGHGIVYWEEVPGATAYLVRVTNRFGERVEESWVYANRVELLLPRDLYILDVWASGGRLLRLTINWSDFATDRATPLTPIGATERMQLPFSWIPVPGAFAYLFQLGTSSANVLMEYWVYGSETMLTVSPGQYEWRVIPVNTRGEQPQRVDWTSFTVTSTPLGRENILGTEPDQELPAELATLHEPTDTVKAPDGTIYIADAGSHAIWSLQNGRFGLFAGTLESGYNGDGYRTSVRLKSPTALALDSVGNLFVMDAGNYLLRKIDLSTGQVATLAGLPEVPGLPTDGAVAATSRVGLCNSLDWDSAGNLYMPMSREGTGDISAIFYLTPNGIFRQRTLPPAVPMSDVVRDMNISDSFLDLLEGSRFYRVYADGTVASVALDAPFGKGIVYVPETQVTYVGSYTQVVGVDAQLSRTSFGPRFANVVSLLRTETGLLVLDSDGHSLVQLDENGRKVNGDNIAARRMEGVSEVSAVALYDSDTVLFLATTKPRIFAYSLSTGRTWVFAGLGLLQDAIEGLDKMKTGFWFPSAIAVDSNKNVFVAEGNRILKIDAAGRVSLYAGTLEPGDGGDGGPAEAARFRSIGALVFDHADNLYVADTYNNKIRKIASDGTVTTVAGTGLPGIAVSGQLASTQPLNHPQGVLPLPDGTVVIADSWNNIVVRVESWGTVSHLAGVPLPGTHQGQGAYDGDGGPATQAWLNTPVGLAVSPTGDLFIVDAFNHRIRRVDASGFISTVWGVRSGYLPDGSLLNLPRGLLTVPGSLLVLDTGNHLVGKLRLEALP